MKTPRVDRIVLEERKGRLVSWKTVRWRHILSRALGVNMWASSIFAGHGTLRRALLLLISTAIAGGPVQHLG